MGIEARAQDAGSEVVSKGGDEVFIGGRKFDEAGEVGGYGI